MGVGVCLRLLRHVCVAAIVVDSFIIAAVVTVNIIMIIIDTSSTVKS